MTMKRKKYTMVGMAGLPINIFLELKNYIVMKTENII